MNFEFIVVVVVQASKNSIPYLELILSFVFELLIYQLFDILFRGVLVD